MYNQLCEHIINKYVLEERLSNSYVPLSLLRQASTPMRSDNDSDDETFNHDLICYTNNYTCSKID